MTYTPNSYVYLCKTPLENDYEHQIDFKSKEAQLLYFESKSVLRDKIGDDSYTYIKKDSSINLSIHIDEILECNYLYYRNKIITDTGDIIEKIYYCFIDDMTYINESCTNVKIKTDVFQTWYFDIVKNPCLVEREHVSSDNYFEHLLDENLDFGEYTTKYKSDFSSITNSHVVMGSTVNPSNPSQDVGGNIYGGIYSGVNYYIFESYNDLNSAILRITSVGRPEGIINLFYLPDSITKYNEASFDENGVAEIPSTTLTKLDISISIPLYPKNLDNYTPKNKKLFNYPYCYYNLSNNSGANSIYKLENFYTNKNTGEINVYGVCTPGGSIRAVPVNYLVSSSLGDIENDDYGLTGGKFPICSWQTDFYTNWLTQNGINIGIETAKALGDFSVGAAATIFTGGIGSVAGGGKMLSGIEKTLNVFDKQRQASLVANQASGNVNSGDVTFGKNQLTFTGYFNVIKDEYAKRIDDFLSMYGYKRNIVKIPNITGRLNWNYVKCVNCNFDGNIPQFDLNEIRSIFDKGITIWHNPSNIYNYNLENYII